MFVMLLTCVMLGVAADARSGGGNPWLWGAAAAFGFALLPILGGLIYRSPGNSFQGDGVFWSYFGGFLWMVIVAIYARFRLGSRCSDS